MTEKEMLGVAVMSVVFAVIYDFLCDGGELCKCFVRWILMLSGM